MPIARRVAQRLVAALDLRRRAHHREEDPIGACVHRDLHLGLVDPRHPDERRAPGARGGGDHRGHRLAPDGAVLAIDHEEVGARRGDRLDRDRRRDRAQDALQDLSLLGEPLLDEHRISRREPRRGRLRAP
jgi:hypothetical protein